MYVHRFASIRILEMTMTIGEFLEQFQRYADVLFCNEVFNPWQISGWSAGPSIPERNGFRNHDEALICFQGIYLVNYMKL